jgi:hypothetical protein
MDGESCIVIWDYSLMMWHERNEGVHKTSKTILELEMMDIMAKVNTAYESVKQALDPSSDGYLMSRSKCVSKVAWLQ